MSIPQDATEAFGEEVDALIIRLGDATSHPKVMQVAEAIGALLVGGQNGENFLALTLAVALVLSEMPRRQRGLALGAFCKLVLETAPDDDEDDDEDEEP